ncbi:sugar kinase [Sphingobacterium sp. N143]|uniref:sugar kinase n=1 Tax=Sphingobacterium sp. N143 TaxID=2746727 RepID=UPI00257875B3|nr:sugar kinase [Sphingobacterium sp. N143]MDM1293940.1 sugar kinase [Sphingobacterium sp. N143]
MSNHRILCFGELLIRLQSVSEGFFEQNNLKIYPGGSEANVAAALGQLKIPTRYITAMPRNPMTLEIQQILIDYGVDTSKILFQGDRLGSYMLLSANGLSNGEVIYDRKYSSFSQIQVGSIDWDSVFDHITWFHFTALTPALNTALAEVCLEALKIASKKGIIISIDLNYRNKLWQYGMDPIEVMPELLKYVDVIMGNIWAANKMLGTSIEAHFDDKTTKEEYFAHAQKVSKEIFYNYPQCKHIANTFRFMENVNHNLFYATYHTPLDNFVSTTYETRSLIDRIGSGDAFMAGLIAAIASDLEEQQIIDFATKIGFDKLFVKGDFIKF